MGIFSSVGKISGMLGGAESSGSSGSSSGAAGFALLPPEIQKAFTDYAGQTTGLFANGGANSMFTPMAQTQDETNAFTAMRQGFAPTTTSLGRDLQMLMNPYDENVIQGMNREAMGQNSLVNQAATQAGQQGSNRSFLGTSDVEQNRLNNIGMFKQSQYNNAIDQILGPLSGLRQQDAQNLMGIGTFQRGLDTATRQAPYSALQAYGGLLGALPQSGGSTQQSSQSSESQGQSGGLGGLLQTAGTIASLFSDARLKENIEQVGEQNGFPIYEFNYKNIPEVRYRGVMAQDVLEIMPEAVGESEGYMTVNYDMIGVTMREV